MGEIFLRKLSVQSEKKPPERYIPALDEKPAVELAENEDPIECEPVKRYGCAFWRSDWQACTIDHESRITAREFGFGGPGYCFFEMRCACSKFRTAKQGWYLNWRNFTPAKDMRLIADYRPVACGALSILTTREANT